MATAASAEGLVEIRHSALADYADYSGKVLYYWCIEKDQIPSEYADSSDYIVAGAVPESKANGGILILLQADKGVFLTSEDCLEETIELFKSAGGNPDDLTLTKK
ncbi:MAG: hypothetical protein J0L76_13495 [Rhodobacterales bacterium]|nr:hypothetical protein [Rhodobacterales bacterium]